MYLNLYFAEIFGESPRVISPSCVSMFTWSKSYQEVEARHYWKHDYRIVTEVIIMDAIADEEFLADIFGDYYIPRINLPGFGSQVATFDRFWNLTFSFVDFRKTTSNFRWLIFENPYWPFIVFENRINNWWKVLRVTKHSIRSDPWFSKMDDKKDSVRISDFRQLSKSDIFIHRFSKINQLKSNFRWLIFENRILTLFLKIELIIDGRYYT